MSLLDKLLDQNMTIMKKMHKKMLDMEEEVINENGEQIERLNKRNAELGASGTKIHYKAAADGIKESLNDKDTKFCNECGAEIIATAKFCNECGTKQE